MPRLTIDQREVEVPAGSTILDAARQLGIDVPTLCHLNGYPPSTSCLVCVVKLAGSGRIVPSCATAASDGMEVESETEEVHHLRRTALELLLSDHQGDCLAPCHFACPAHMDIPVMLRQIHEGQTAAAIATVKQDIALPAVLGRVCPKPCEKGCRRNVGDGPVAVCQLKRYVADLDLASGSPYVPPRQAPSGKRVAIVGGGATGLSAAYYLAQQGHACTILEDRPQLGGRMRTEFKPEDLPSSVLEGEIAALLAVGIEVRLAVRVGRDVTLAQLRQDFDAVLIACGAMARDQDAAWEVAVDPRGIRVNKETFATSTPGVFAAGNALRAKGLLVRSAADGKEAAHAIDQYLRGEAMTGPPRPFSSRLGKIDAAEVPAVMALAVSTGREEPVRGNEYLADQASQQAQRCLHCDCSGLSQCKLRRYAEHYGADASRYAQQRRALEPPRHHGRVIYEPGKCINCGLCIQIVTAAKEPLGLAFVGRGFDVRVGVPFDRSMDEALGKVAAECIAACPTAALSFRPEVDPKALPILDG